MNDLRDLFIGIAVGIAVMLPIAFAWSWLEEKRGMLADGRPQDADSWHDFWPNDH